MSDGSTTFAIIMLSISVSILAVSSMIDHDDKQVETEYRPNPLLVAIESQAQYYHDNPFELLKNPIFLLSVFMAGFGIFRMVSFNIDLSIFSRKRQNSTVNNEATE